MQRTILAGITITMLCACGGERAPGIAGPGDTRLGQTIEEIEAAHPKWTLEANETLPDGRNARQYRDFHFTIYAGLMHPADHPILYFRDGKLESWK